MPCIDAAIHVRRLKSVRFWRIFVQHGCVLRGYVGIFLFEGLNMSFLTLLPISTIRTSYISRIEGSIQWQRIPIYGAVQNCGNTL
jgi:hypothetical protein